MTAPGPSAGARQDPWEEEGGRIAAVLATTASAVVLGSNPAHAARVALGIARAEATRRRVALGDLVGDLSPLYSTAGGEDAFGLSDCIRGGLSLNEVARPAPECDALFILPAGSPPVATHDILAHERWPRLVKGFAEAGALLLLVAPLDAPGLEALVSATGGIIAVDVPARRVREFTVLASVAPPEPVAPMPPVGRARPRIAPVAAGVAALALALSAWFAWPRQAGVSAGTRGAGAAETPSPPSGASPAAAPRPDTLTVREPVNPGDSARAARFAVEVVAANTSAGANSFLRDSQDPALPAVTVAPVQLGRGALWYKLIVGASRTREAADSLLGALRGRKEVRRDAGAVVQVPYALLLGDGLGPDDARARVASWRERGVSAYALVQDDGSVRVYAGAFETAAQAATLAATVRDAGSTPLVAFRTGRPF